MKETVGYLTLTSILILALFFGCGHGSSSPAAGDDRTISDAYSIGHDRLSVEDPERDERIITYELFYPATTDGEQSPHAEGVFALIVFAHGYQQEYSDYHDLWETLVPLGYIIAFPTTYQGLTIDIDDYAEDIRFLHDRLLHSTSDNDSILTGHLSERSALMGHSTGGGAIYLAHDSLPQSTTLVSMAALTRPYEPIYGSKPLDIAANITVPSLILSGKQDCITPVDVHQKPLYDALGGDKSMITITKGDHCGFSDSLNCPVAESLSCGVLFQGDTMDKSEQRALTLEFIIPWLGHHLQDDPQAWASFEALTTSDLVESERVTSGQ
jgi:pimeloyl-ACP methyl ester carboxylesterase